MPEVTANGIRQHYELSGEGDHTIAWIHGVGGSLEYWREDVPKFAGYRHLIYDVRGMGQSDVGEEPASLALWARDLAALLDALDIPRAIVAGSSMGGVIAQRFGIDFPERTEGLVLLSTSSRVGPQAEAAWLKRAEESDARGQHAVAAAQRAVASYNMDEELKSVRVPTLILVGDADRTTPPGGSVIISRLVEGSELEIYEGVGHAPLHEEPRAVERLQRWLRERFGS